MEFDHLARILREGLASAGTLARSLQGREWGTRRDEVEEIERSEVELLNAAAQSSAERLIQDHIVGPVIANYGEIDVICEEETDLTFGRAKEQARYTLLVDPIDFTRDYIEGGSRYAITATVCESGVPVFGVVEFPGKHYRLIAEKGRGVWENRGDKATRLYATPRAGGSIVANKRALGRLRAAVTTCGYRVEPMQFTLEDVLRCVAGQVSGVVSCRNKAHDLAAATLVASEAGMFVSSCEGHPIRFDRAHLDSNLRVPFCLAVTCDEVVFLAIRRGFGA